MKKSEEGRGKEKAKREERREKEKTNYCRPPPPGGTKDQASIIKIKFTISSSYDSGRLCARKKARAVVRGSSAVVVKKRREAGGGGKVRCWAGGRWPVEVGAQERKRGR